LTFTAGQAQVLTQPQITGISRSGANIQISFSTASGQKYQLDSAAVVSGPYTPLGNTVTGDGNTQTLSDSISTPARFYRIQTSN
jgi:hypothetical protein